MKFFTFRMICIGAAVCGFAELLSAQQAADIYFRQPPRTARSIGVADAAVADARSVGGAAWNPASLAFLESVSADVTLIGRTDALHARSDVSVPVVVNESFAVAVSGAAASFDRDGWSEGAGMLYGGSAMCALRIMPAVSVGAVYNFQTASLGSASASSHNGGVGFIYSPQPALTYGLSVTGFGSGITFSRNDSMQTIAQEGSIPRSVTLGGGWRYPTTHDRVVFSCFLSGQKIIGVGTNVYRLGVEVLPWGFLALRGGIVSGPVTTAGRGGIGLRTGFIELDYALTTSTAEERMHVLTLSIPLFTR